MRKTTGKRHLNQQVNIYDARYIVNMNRFGVKFIYMHTSLNELWEGSCATLKIQKYGLGLL